MDTYETLKARVLEMMDKGQLSPVPTREERIDFAYGNTKIENDDVTRGMVEAAVDKIDRSR
jgi:hypothetical protein